MNMIIAAMNGELEPSPKTERLCRAALMVAVVTLVVLLVVTILGGE